MEDLHRFVDQVIIKQKGEEAYWYLSKNRLPKRKFSGWKMEDEGGR